ncbi:MAG: neutral zinc metallopeptidase [Gemmatimonadales bacterium]
MTRFEQRRFPTRLIVVPAALALTVPTGARAQVEVGETELAAVRVDASRAATLLESAWGDVPRAAGAPGPVVAYSDSQPTGCGMLGPENAFYCEHDDAIYYDEWFVAAIRGMVAQELETDGNQAVFAILAHEWGHRIYTRFRPNAAGIPVLAELAADCLAGAALGGAGQQVPLGAEDTAEAELAIRLLGDEPDVRAGQLAARWSARPAPGDPAARGRAQRGLTRHGDADERVRSFRRGLRHGAGKCMKELGQAR